MTTQDQLALGDRRACSTWNAEPRYPASRFYFDRTGCLLQLGLSEEMAIRLAADKRLQSRSSRRWLSAVGGMSGTGLTRCERRTRLQGGDDEMYLRRHVGGYRGRVTRRRDPRPFPRRCATPAVVLLSTGAGRELRQRHPGASYEGIVRQGRGHRLMDPADADGRERTATGLAARGCGRIEVCHRVIV